MTIAQLQNEILNDLAIELSGDTDYNADLLAVKVKNAIREVRTIRSYPAHYTEDMIADDLYTMYSDISRLAVIDYNQVGAQGQSSHKEDDVQRNWESRDSILSNIHAFVKIL